MIAWVRMESTAGKEFGRFFGVAKKFVVEGS